MCKHSRGARGSSEGLGGITNRTRVSADFSGGVLRLGAVPGAEIYHFSKSKHWRDFLCDLSVQMSAVLCAFYKCSLHEIYSSVCYL